MARSCTSMSTVFLILGLLMTHDLGTAESCVKSTDGNTQLSGNCGQPFTLLVSQQALEIAFTLDSGTSQSHSTHVFDLTLGKCKVPMKLGVGGGISSTLNIGNDPLTFPVSAAATDGGIKFIGNNNATKDAPCPTVEFKPHGTNFTVDFHLESGDLSKLAALSIVIKAPLAPGPEGSTWGTAEIVGIVGGVVAVLGIIIVVVLVVVFRYCKPRRQAQSKRQDGHQAELGAQNTKKAGDVSSANPVPLAGGGIRSEVLPVNPSDGASGPTATLQRTQGTPKDELDAIEARVKENVDKTIAATHAGHQVGAGQALDLYTPRKNDAAKAKREREGEI